MLEESNLIYKIRLKIALLAHVCMGLCVLRAIPADMESCVTQRIQQRYLRFQYLDWFNWVLEKVQ